jgi:hypothetical protein
MPTMVAPSKTYAPYLAHLIGPASAAHIHGPAARHEPLASLLAFVTVHLARHGHPHLDTRTDQPGGLREDLYQSVSVL